MPFPATKIDMLEEGYTFAGMKVCPCGASMELWNTPRGQIMPMNPMNDLYAAAVVHWATCPKAEQFRRKK
jgi:hypothetical protein